MGTANPTAGSRLQRLLLVLAGREIVVISKDDNFKWTQLKNY
ncbi:MAG: hypothetical protein P4L51_01760 [Puia sp.]|nr:hypothetical protein [Puia sp.]